MKPYGYSDFDQHWLRQWLVTWWHEVIYLNQLSLIGPLRTNLIEIFRMKISSHVNVSENILKISAICTALKLLNNAKHTQ